MGFGWFGQKNAGRASKCGIEMIKLTAVNRTKVELKFVTKAQLEAWLSLLIAPKWN
jgi:hypothetical protein